MVPFFVPSNSHKVHTQSHKVTKPSKFPFVLIAKLSFLPIPFQMFIQSFMLSFLPIPFIALLSFLPSFPIHTILHLLRLESDTNHLGVAIRGVVHHNRQSTTDGRRTRHPRVRGVSAADPAGIAYHTRPVLIDRVGRSTHVVAVVAASVSTARLRVQVGSEHGRWPMLSMVRAS
jgi:hypothetical protein